MRPLLDVQRVSKMFGGLQALQDVSFDVSAGEVVGMMGANGAGKTTMFNLISGNFKPSGGQILFDGQSVVGMSADRICRMGIARTFQIVRPFNELTLLDSVFIAAQFGARTRKGRSQAQVLAAEILDIVGLAERKDELAATLTLADQKRLEVARAISTGARLVMLDEVMAGLTPREVTEMLSIIRDLKARFDLTIIIIEHVISALMNVSDRIVILHHGETVAIGSPDVVARDPRVLACYLGTKS